MTDRPNYYAVLPASVRYDETLRANAKLLYAEISALCNTTGFCTAQNDYFSGLYGVGKKTVSELIGQLASRGYIKVEVLREKSGRVTGRHIWLTDPPEEENPPPKIRDTSPEKSGDPIPKNREYLKGVILQDKINTPIAPKKGDGKLPKSQPDPWAGYADGDADLLQALRDFELMRTRRKKPMTDRARQLLLGKLDKLSGGGRETKIQLLDTAIVHCWDTVYPLKDSQKTEQTKPTRKADDEWL